MKKEIIADVTQHDARVALLEDGELAEIQVELKGNERLVGNIYKGRVQNVLPGMQAAFVDIGLDKNAFLYVGDILADKGDFDFNRQKGSGDHSSGAETARRSKRSKDNYTYHTSRTSCSTHAVRGSHRCLQKDRGRIRKGETERDHRKIQACRDGSHS